MERERDMCGGGTTLSFLPAASLPPALPLPLPELLCLGGCDAAAPDAAAAVAAFSFCAE